MTTPLAHPVTQARVPLRLHLDTDVADGPRPQVDGAWWPQSRDLVTEATDLVDHFPEDVGRVSRLLFSRPDWDVPADGTWARTLVVRRGKVKAGSFPADDSRTMILKLSTGRRLHLTVVPPGTPDAEAEQLLAGTAPASPEQLQ